MPDALLIAGAAWMVQQTKSAAWSTPDPAETITDINPHRRSDRDHHGAAAGGVRGAAAAGG